MNTRPLALALLLAASTAFAQTTTPNQITEENVISGTVTMDFATRTNLDTSGEAALSAAIDEMKRRRCTLLIVGHRPSTIALADRILLMKEGRVELIGPRDEVLKRLRKAASSKTGADDVDAARTA